ncbi:universal stress protein [Saccharopolyspora sp. NPDC049426]|uniref:universal stress protein n=1 Tax=Saccharopolyspora sp. NPDC049426 TaxID=3155652 RepID=UPI003420E763
MNNAHKYTIVVGVDGSPPSVAALRWAAWHAAQTDGQIVAVMAWDQPLIYNWQVPESDDIARRAATRLSETVAEVVTENSEVAVRNEVASGHPASALLDAAEDVGADLIAVGHRGHGGFTEALLGSVSQHVMHHAHCPVIVVRNKE